MINRAAGERQTLYHSSGQQYALDEPSRGQGEVGHLMWSVDMIMKMVQLDELGSMIA